MAETRMRLMQGNEACLEGALYAGMRFFAGYPITPSTEIAEQASLRLPQVGGSFLQMEDELSSMAAIIGGSCAGVKSMTATSGPGFSLMQENIGYASLCEIPCVVVNVQRSGPSTGLPTSPSQGDVMQARWGTHGDHPVIAISPSSVPECFELTVRCFNLSEKYRTPVIFLMDEIIGHMREGVEIPEGLPVVERLRTPQGVERRAYEPDPDTLVPSFPPFGEGSYYHITGLLHDERGYPTSDPTVSGRLCRRLMEKIERGAEDIIQTEELLCGDADTIVVCYGGTARAVKQAVIEAREQGIKAGMLRLITIWPFAEKQVARAAGSAGHIIVAEHNYGQIVHEVERAVSGSCPVSFIGKVDGTTIAPEEVLEKIKAVTK